MLPITETNLFSYLRTVRRTLQTARLADPCSAAQASMSTLPSHYTPAPAPFRQDGSGWTKAQRPGPRGVQALWYLRGIGADVAIKTLHGNLPRVCSVCNRFFASASRFRKDLS